MTLKEFSLKHNIPIHIVSGLQDFLKVEDSTEVEEIALEEAFYLFTGKKLKKSERHTNVLLQEKEEIKNLDFNSKKEKK